MLDDDIKSVEKLGKILHESTEGGKRKPKWSESEKQLCLDAQTMIDSHVQGCSVCQLSFKSYQANMNIPMTPPCSQFTTNLKIHISMCQYCNSANKKWNEDSIPVTNEIRQGVAVLVKIQKLLKL